MSTATTVYAPITRGLRIVFRSSITGRLPFKPMDAAFEVSPDDPQRLAEAIQRAAQGAVVHLVRDGQAVADIVPAASTQQTDNDRNDRALAIERRQAQRFGAPTLADYRKVYETSGWPWPGDDMIRRDYLVADAR